MTKQEVLQSANFGHRVAEEESKELERYFVATDQWKRTFAGDVDIIYGAKGTGKSALYSLLIQRASDLLDKGVIVVSAEQPRGTPVFKDLQQDPPTTEREFTGLWRLYLLSLLGATLKEYSANDASAIAVLDYLEQAKLLESTTNLPKMLRNVFEYVKRVFRPSAVQGEIKIDPMTGLPAGFSGKISFDEVSIAADQSIQSVNELLKNADKAFAKLGVTVWILLDRLDVAFAETDSLEENALRALFRNYLELTNLSNVRLKIFLRTDIWNRLTKTGFREASHVTRHLTISWDRSSLMSLMLRRAVNNESICTHYSIKPDEVFSSIANQETLFYRIFPKQVDVGLKKPKTLDWMIGHTKDGTGHTAPRELIHLLSVAREMQLRHFEVGDKELDQECIFSSVSFREALPKISDVRLSQTLFAEYPKLRPFIDKLAGEKTQQYSGTLAGIWQVNEIEALAIANSLVEVGFFELRGTKTTPYFWVPFLYRDAARMIQGDAD
ncbi:MAG: hypothetical protein HZB59_06185 [Ignavibacteriales bacterium]|nr:hypothetical protein [Ignavibacteriales bacterium]